MHASGPVEESLLASIRRATPAREGGAFSAVFAEDALADARRADSRIADGAVPRPLEATVLAVKDLVAVSGHPIGAGSASRAGAAPEVEDAQIVALLRRLGAVVLGLATLHELAFGVTGVNPHDGTPRNPVDPGLVPGGSSSGSAVAVATGAATLAVGTDTGGSVRIPAACCSVVGFKPAYGEYPTEGVLALAPSLDHVGLLAVSVAAIRRAHAALGFDAGLPSLPRRIGLDEAAVARSSPEVRAAVEAAVEVLVAAGAVVTTPQFPDPGVVAEVSTLILFAEAAREHWAAAKARPSDFGSDIRRRLELGSRFAADAATLERARAEAREIRRRMATALASCDVLVSPTLPRRAPTPAEAADEHVSAELVAFTRLYNIAGIPALSLPLPAARGVGLQLAASSSPILLGSALAVEAQLASSVAARPGAAQPITDDASLANGSDR